MPTLRFLTAFFFLLFSVCENSALAQAGPGFETISTEQGLTQGLINDMLQDREGFIWIATKGGLNRYDGYSCKTFTNDPADTNSISSNAVSTLLEDSQGRIWIGTYDGGVNVYDKKSGRFLRIVQKAGIASGLSSSRIVSAMIELPGGRILVAPQGGSMNIISLAGSRRDQLSITTLNGPGNSEVLGIGKDDKGYIWAGCMDGSVFIFNPTTASFELLSDGHTFTGLIEKTGTYLTARSSQVFFLKPIPDIPIEFMDSTGRLQPDIKNSKNGQGELLNKLLFSRAGPAGSLFYDFSSMRSGSNINDGRAFYLKSTVNEQTIKCVLIDRSGVLWVGMLGHGLYKYRIGSDRFKPILPKFSIQRVVTLNKDIIYLHGWNSVKTVTPEGAECTNPLAAVVGNSSFTDVLQAKNGDYWAYNLNQKKVFHYAADALTLLAAYAEPVNSIPTEQLQPMIEDSKHRIWVCGANGTLARIDPASGKLSRFVINAALPAGTSILAQTTVFYEDSAGMFWMGTEHGFARLLFPDDDGAPAVKWFENIPGNSNSLSYDYVSWFMDDPVDPGYLWISTKGGGLNRMQKSTGIFIHYTTKQGLPNDVVYGTLTDKAGNIWGSTNRGLFCMLTKTKEDAAPVFRVFSTSDGLQADEFNTNAFTKLTNGNLVFGGINGLNIFNPQKILENSFTPGVYITGIQIGNKMIIPGDETGVLEETIEQTHSITLNHLQDVLTLEFSSLDFTAPQQNKYRYQLTGIDKEWVESGTRRTATYLHLPPGNYTFKVQGSNSQGMWSDKIAELKVKVLPPWWRSSWAYVVYVLLIVLAIRAYLRFNVNKAKLQSQLNFEQMEAKRVKELDTVKTQLYTNITHEFRTPLTVILGMAQQIAEKPGEQFGPRIDMIVRNGRSLLNLVNELLDLSKLETGKMQLQLSHGDIIHFLRYIVESFHSLAENQQKQLHFLTEIDTLYLEYDREKLRQIVSNLLSNAIKFTPEKGNIYISVTERAAAGRINSASLVIKVKDTGIGIPEEQLQYIFDRFYQLDNSHTRKEGGTGIGLSLTKELVKLMEGEISVKSPPAGAHKGSEFIVALPLKRVETVEEESFGDVKKQTTASLASSDIVVTPVSGEEKKGNAPLILLVEDNADVVAYTASCLTDYRLAVGKDGREGFEIATQMIPDLVISDVMMPFVDGFEMVEKLRANEFTSHIPVIMLTAKADIKSKIEGLQRGAEAYLEKPFNKEELQVRIQKLLELRKNLQQYYLKEAGINRDDTAPAVTQETISVRVIEDIFVKRIREVVEQNLADIDFTVEKLTKLTFMSHSQLHRKLEALTGYSPTKFIRMLRFKKAKQLLQDPENSVASVALDCGYNDPGYFARIFKQEHQMTPQEWRIANS